MHWMKQNGKYIKIYSTERKPTPPVQLHKTEPRTLYVNPYFSLRGITNQCTRTDTRAGDTEQKKNIEQSSNIEQI